MRSVIACYAVLVFVTANARGAFTDFSDYTHFTSFYVGDTFESNGVGFKVVPLAPVSHPVWVQGVLLPGPGAEFLLPPGVQEVSMKYADGAGSFIAINGVQPNYPPLVNYPMGFGYLSGTTLGGVQLTAAVTRNGIGFQEGTLFLNGPISSLVIAGLELSLDDVYINVPEPAAATLALFAAAALMRCRRRFAASL